MYNPDWHKYRMQWFVNHFTHILNCKSTKTRPLMFKLYCLPATCSKKVGTGKLADVFTWAHRNRGYNICLEGIITLCPVWGRINSIWNAEAGILKLKNHRRAAWREARQVLEGKLLDNDSYCHPIKVLKKLLSRYVFNCPDSSCASCLSVTAIRVALFGLKGRP